MNDKKPENPSAFPCGGDNGGGDVIPFENGMSLRDYFAGQVVAGSVVDVLKRYDNYPSEKKRILEDIGKVSYQIADALLKAREEK